ncbi:MAG: hypothetical protein KDE24_34080, partial [Caldilinea sp.]|nr:hypothetical protein [Caldilinea sp.]
MADSFQQQVGATSDGVRAGSTAVRRARTGKKKGENTIVLAPEKMQSSRLCGTISHLYATGKWV